MNNGHAVEELTEITLDSGHGTLTALTRKGQGTPVVVVHGVMADARAWRNVVKTLAPGRPILVLNRRGRTPSASLNEGYGVDTEVRDLLLWLATLESPADLVGHSYGGLIAVEAIRRGARIRSLVLYEPVARPFGSFVAPFVTAAVNAGDLDAAVEIINVDLSGYTREHVEVLRASPAWPKLLQLAVPAGAELLGINEFAFAASESWTIPTTIVAGERSRHRPPYGPSVDLFLHALHVSDVVILAGQDHLAHVTAPQELARAIDDGIGDRSTVQPPITGR